MVCYDIVDDNRRRKIQKILEGYGERVQYSVFECDLSDYEYDSLRKKIISSIDKKCDSTRFYNICSSCHKKIEFIGNGTYNRMIIFLLYKVCLW